MPGSPSGWPHEPNGNVGPRWMIAVPVWAGTQNSAYRLAQPKTMMGPSRSGGPISCLWALTERDCYP